MPTRDNFTRNGLSRQKGEISRVKFLRSYLVRREESCHGTGVNVVDDRVATADDNNKNSVYDVVEVSS